MTWHEGRFFCPCTEFGAISAATKNGRNMDFQEELTAARIVPVIVIKNAAHAVPLAKAQARNGFPLRVDPSKIGKIVRMHAHTFIA